VGERAAAAAAAAVARQEARRQGELLARVEAEAARVAGLLRADADAADEARALLARAAAGRAAALGALRAQEGQLARLADAVPALDMAHSALLSAAAPRRRPVDRLMEAVLAPRLLASPAPRPAAAAPPPPVRVVAGPGGGDSGPAAPAAGWRHASAGGGPGGVLYASSPYFEDLKAHAPAAAVGRLYASAELGPLAPATAEQAHALPGAGPEGGPYASRPSVVSESVLSRRPLAPPPSAPQDAAGGPAPLEQGGAGARLASPALVPAAAAAAGADSGVV
jgi:hypothetical protein